MRKKIQIFLQGFLERLDLFITHPEYFLFPHEYYTMEDFKLSTPLPSVCLLDLFDIPDPDICLIRKIRKTNIWQVYTHCGSNIKLFEKEIMKSAVVMEYDWIDLPDDIQKLLNGFDEEMEVVVA